MCRGFSQVCELVERELPGIDMARFTDAYWRAEAAARPSVDAGSIRCGEFRGERFAAALEPWCRPSMAASSWCGRCIDGCPAVRRRARLPGRAA